MIQLTKVMPKLIYSQILLKKVYFGKKNFRGVEYFPRKRVMIGQLLI